MRALSRTLGPALLLALVGATAAAAPAPIAVDGPRLRLSDLGVAEAGLDGDLGPAPAPGARRRIYRHQILAVVGNARRRVPAHLEVQTRAQTLTCGELVRRIREALAGHLPEGLRAGPIPCARPLLLPRGELRVEVRLLSERRSGAVPLQVVLQVGEWPPQTLALRVELAGTLKVAVAAVELAANTPLGTADVRLEARPAAGLPSDALGSLAELAGMKTTAPLREGAVLRRGSLAPVPLVRRGSQVTIAVEGEGLRLTTRGVAREDGRRGDTIAVLCAASNKLIRARVVDAHRVALDL